MNHHPTPIAPDGPRRSSLVRTRAAVGSLVVTTLLTTSPGLAAASHGKDPGADNIDHSVSHGTLSADKGQLAFDWGTDRLAQGINVWYGGGDTDVQVYEGDYGPTGWHGLTRCKNYVPYHWDKCDDFTVKLNSHQYKTANQWKSLGAHELGHTVGLGHRSEDDDADDNSAMRVEIWPLDFDSHDLNTFDW